MTTMVLQGFGYILDSNLAQVGALLVLAALLAPFLAFLDIRDRLSLIEQARSSGASPRKSPRKSSFFDGFLGGLLHFDPILLFIVYLLCSPLLFTAYILSPIFCWNRVKKTWPLLHKQVIVWGATLAAFILGIALIILGARPI